MEIAELREELGLTQAAFAARVGLRSKGYVCELEAADKPRASVRVALEIEKLSGGRIKAAELNPGVALVRGVG